MKYERSLGAWLHKPGNSAILKYKYTPSTSRAWTDEGCYGGAFSAGNGYIYNSTIYYFTYSTNHHYSLQSQGDTSAHIMECDGCGKTMREGHTPNASSNTCKVCGRTGPFTVDTINPVDDILSIDALLPSAEVLYNEAHEIEHGN